MREYNVDEIDGCGQFHQHFTYKFFVRMFFWQLFSSYMYVEKAAQMMFIQKICTFNVDENDGWRSKATLTSSHFSNKIDFSKENITSVLLLMMFCYLSSNRSRILIRKTHPLHLNALQMSIISNDNKNFNCRKKED